MLKWLKQKPAGHNNNNNDNSNHRNSHQGSQHDVSKTKIITDDPLATIQVHPQHQKKSKNKSEEIYAVSRVNPLFEEEDIPAKTIGVGIGSGFRGNNSGSSGYDSASTSDDGELSKFNVRRNTQDNLSTSSTSSFSVLNRAPSKHGQLFRDDDMVHHQAAILGPNGRPILHIMEQNPDYVQSISVSVKGAGGGRPLTPIDESAIALNRGKVSVHPVPCRSKGEDYLGVAKLIQKDNKFVHSIRVGSNCSNSGGIKVPKREEPSRLVHSSTHSHIQYPPPPVTRKPSVTFSERVELVLDNNGNGKLLVKGGNTGAGPYRKPSTEQDSIVTESLLLMTSRPLGLQESSSNNAIVFNSNNSNSNGGINRLFNPSKSSDQLPALFSSRKVSTESSESYNANRNHNHGGSRIGRQDESQRQEDLEAFSTSIRKNHPVKHILSNSGKSLEIGSAADHYSSAEFLEVCDAVGDIDSRHYKSSISASGSVSCGSEEYSNETRSSSNDDQQDDRRRPRGNVCGKSPFGGIADHYAAAKEIAKEIESYSNGDAKSTSKKSIVRELLSGRGREALHHIHNNYNNYSNNNDGSGDNKKSPKLGNSVLGQLRHVGAVGSGKEAWESVRVQQVYLKGRSWKEIEPSSSSSTSSQEGDAGQRVVSVIQQGQVHSNKKDRNANLTITNNTTTTTTTSLQQSAKQLLKGSIYYGHSSEGGTSNNEGDDDASSDSGNSTDRNSKGSRQDLITERRPGPSKPKGLAPKPPEPSSIEEDSLDQVMIVTGDSQNLVVDLCGVPQDLRDAILAGTAVITLPDGLNSSVSSKKGGNYTIVSIPTPSQTQSKPKAKVTKTFNVNSNHPSSSSNHPESSNLKQPLGELEIKTIPIPSSEDLSKLEMGELYGHIFNNYGTKNKTQIWDVMQQSVQQTLIEDEKGKKKRITTILPIHPCQDVYKSPDFTMEGQRQERQKKKLDFAKKRRCVCRVFGIFFFLATFLGVLVALSMIYTKGQRYFGSA